MRNWGFRQCTPRPFLWACVSVVFLPALAWAQVSVQYRTLTLVESAYLYSGLALQSVLRLSSLRQLPQIIIACGVVWLLYRRVTGPHPQPLAGVVAYVVSCSVILVLFWPEAAPRFFSPLTTRVFPGAVTSYVAERNAMVVDDAGSSRLVPASLQTAGGAPVPRFTHLLLRVVTTVPLTLGEAIDGEGLERPFHRIPALRELMQQEVPPGLTAMMPEFVNHCYNPASVQSAQTAGLAFEKVAPWGSVMSAQLARLDIPTDRGLVLTLKTWLPALFGAPTANCKTFYDGMEADVSGFLAGEATQQGSSKRQQYLDVLGLQAQSQATFPGAAGTGEAPGAGRGGARTGDAAAAPGRCRLVHRRGARQLRPHGAGQVHDRPDPEAARPPVAVPGRRLLPGLLGAVHRRHRGVRNAGLLSHRAVVVAVSGPALQAHRQLFPAAGVRVLDAACGGRWSTSPPTWRTRTIPRPAPG